MPSVIKTSGHGQTSGFKTCNFTVGHWLSSLKILLVFYYVGEVVFVKICVDKLLQLIVCVQFLQSLESFTSHNLGLNPHAKKLLKLNIKAIQLQFVVFCTLSSDLSQLQSKILINNFCFTRKLIQFFYKCFF